MYIGEHSRSCTHDTLVTFTHVTVSTPYFSQKVFLRGTWGKRQTLDLGSGLDLRAVEFKPCFGLHVGCGAYLKKKVFYFYVFIFLDLFI